MDSRMFCYCSRSLFVDWSTIKCVAHRYRANAQKNVPNQRMRVILPAAKFVLQIWATNVEARKKKTCKKGLVCKPKSLEPWRNRRTDPPGVCAHNTPHCSEFYGSRRLGYMRVFVPVGWGSGNGYYNMDGCIYCKCPKAGGKAHCGDICDWLDLVRAQ